MNPPTKHNSTMLYSLMAAIMLLFASKMVNAANPLSDWSIITPVDKADVKSGELLVTVKLGENIDFVPGTVYFFLDDILISVNIKVRPGMLSMLYMLPLRKGNHKLEVRAKEKLLGWMKPIHIEFYTGRAATIEDKMAIDTTNGKPESNVESMGTLSMEYSNTSIFGSAEAKTLRQAQPYVAEMSLDVINKVQDFSIPVKMFITSNEYNYPKALMPRNYFQVGFIGRQFGLTVGDINPYFDRLVMSGLRVRGLMGSFERQRLKFTVVQGISQRAVEGNIRPFSSSTIAPLPDLWNGNSYITPGYYQRNITAMRLSLGNTQEGSLLNFNLLRAKDNVSSIQYGQNPKENIVLGLDQQFLNSQSGFKMNAGFAFSLYTDDIAPGIATKKEMDSTYGRNFSLNPADVKELFTINSTTIRLTKTSTAGYVAASINLGPHTLSGEYRFIGSAFQSLGNPYLRNDLLSLTVQDQFRFLDKKMSLSSRYTYSENNIIGQMLSTTAAHWLQSNLLYVPGNSLPFFGLILSTQYRSTPTVDNLNMLFGNDLYINTTVTANYRREARHIMSLFNFYYTNTYRQDRMVNGNNIQNHIFSLGANETHLASSLSADVRYTYVLMGFGEKSISPLSNTFDSRFRYVVGKTNTTVGAGFMVNVMSNSDIYGQATRYTYLIELKHIIKKNTQLEAELRYAPYYSYLSSGLSYHEFYARLKFVYFFNYK